MIYIVDNFFTKLVYLIFVSCRHSFNYKGIERIFEAWNKKIVHQKKQIIIIIIIIIIN